MAEAVRAQLEDQVDELHDLVDAGLVNPNLHRAGQLALPIILGAVHSKRTTAHGRDLTRTRASVEGAPACAKREAELS